MRPSIRRQSDGLNDVVSLQAGIAFDPEEDVTRQEFGEEADVNVLLRRYGVGAMPPLTYGEVNWDLDLQAAQLTIRDAREGLERLPLQVLEANGGLDTILRGVLDGTLTELKVPAKESADDVPADAAAGTRQGAAGAAAGS